MARKGASPASPGESSASPGIRTRIKEEDEAEGDLVRDFEGLKVEHDGRISFHGPTSLFQLPSGLLSETSSTIPLAMQLEGRKERLINNAWRERAFEQMATMPVSPNLGNRKESEYKGLTLILITVAGAIPVSPGLTLVLDSTTLRFRLSTYIYSFVPPAS